eukprot:scaffold2608_cov245-Pinguiococcus_pyrenoidosus.AAC.6
MFGRGIGTGTGTGTGNGFGDFGLDRSLGIGAGLGFWSISMCEDATQFWYMHAGFFWGGGGGLGGRERSGAKLALSHEACNMVWEGGRRTRSNPR